MAKIRDYRIVTGSRSAVNERRAAAFVARYIRLVTGVEPAIVTDDTPPQPLEIVIGRTNREIADGLQLDRRPQRQWEFLLQSVGNRLYLTGLGCPSSEEEVGRIVKDGCVGSVFAAYHFVEDILKFPFVYETFDACPFTPEAEMPQQYSFVRTAESLRDQLPPAVEGSVMYSVPPYSRTELNQGCLLFKTRQGRIVVIDGGREKDADHLVECLKALSPDRKPVISAWLMTHIHEDHVGSYVGICSDPALAGQITVEHFYYRLLPREFYTTVSKEASPDFGRAIDVLQASAGILGTQMHTVSEGDVIAVDELSFEALYVPRDADMDRCSVNDTSILFKLTHDSGQTVMLLADAEPLCWEYLQKNCPKKLKSDILQVPHHGSNSVPYECFRAVGAKAAFFQCCSRFWFGENGEGLNTFNVGHIRTRNILRELGMKPENIYRDSNGILTFPLPFSIHETKSRA